MKKIKIKQYDAQRTKIGFVQQSLSDFRRFRKALNYGKQIAPWFVNIPVNLKIMSGNVYFMTDYNNKSTDIVKTISDIDAIMKDAGFKRSGKWAFSYGSYDCAYYDGPKSITFYIHQNDSCELVETEVTEKKMLPGGLCAKALETINLNYEIL
jgi:hypothetical protein